MMEKISLHTGYLFIDDYEKGKLETLSIGDYGKFYNVKADFLGYTRELNGVPNKDCLPLSEKWVITVSSQYGCCMSCNFCDVPNVKFGGNATFNDLKKQLYNAIKLFPSVKYTDRLNIHFARMGEPIFNKAVFSFAEWLYDNKTRICEETGLRIEVIHPVLSTSCPRNLSNLEDRIIEWCDIKNKVYNGQAGLQLSINSTSETQRDEMFRNKQLSLRGISSISERLPMPKGRKYCLNFAYASSFEINAKLLASLFNKEKFMCKITPIHNNNACRDNKLQTIGGYESYEPYRKVEEDLKAEGFDVIVFVPSMNEEDCSVTCGNLVLGGSDIISSQGNIKIQGIRKEATHGR